MRNPDKLPPPTNPPKRHAKPQNRARNAASHDTREPSHTYEQHPQRPETGGVASRRTTHTLASSAMHIRLTCSPDQRPFYASLERQHLSKALESYIPQLGTNTEESCPARFAFSSLLPALSYSFLQAVRTDLQGEDYIKQFTRIWHFLLGATAVVKGERRWINESILAPLVTLESIENVLPQVDSPRTALRGFLHQIRLSGLSAAPGGQGEHHRTQADALSSEARQRSLDEGRVEMLSNAFSTNTNQPPQLPAVIGWPVFIEGVFVQLLARKDPMALIILAYYGAALHTLSGF